MKLLRTGATLSAAALAVPAAQAHLVTSGLGPFYDGIGHFVFSPESWLAALAVALFAGVQREKSAARCALWALPLAWFAGGLLGTHTGELPATVSALTLLALGILVAGAWSWGKPGVVAIAVAAGLVQGAADGGGLGAGRAPVLALLGTVATIAVLTPLVVAAAVATRESWLRIAVRVAGSWIAATGLLLLGWAWRGHFR